MSRIIIFLALFCATIDLSTSKSSKDLLQEKFTNIFIAPKFSFDLNTFQISFSQTFENDIQFVLSNCNSNDLFRDMESKHLSATHKLITMLREIENTQELLDFAAYLRDYPGMNRALWTKAMLTVTAGRADLIGLHKPDPATLVINQLLTPEAHSAGLRQAKMPPQQRECIPLDGSVTSVDNGVEHALWHFREDLLANYEHFYWHAFYPIDASLIPENQNRIGELFYWYHHNMLIRYNVERLGAGFNRVIPIVVEEGFQVEEFYYPHLSEFGGSTDRWGYRLPNSTFKNITMWVDLVNTIYEDIDNGALISANGTKIPLINYEGVDLIAHANMRSSLCPNIERYDENSIHSRGHHWISQLSVEGEGIMTNLLIVLRDPVFYRWHYWVDGMFQRHKTMLEPYNVTEGEFPLLWEGVSITQVEVKSDRPGATDLNTYFGSINASVPYSPDFGPIEDGNLDYCIKRLEHDPFTYTITIEREASVASGEATIRILMAPRLNESGGRLPLEEQRQLMFSMDEFKINLTIGTNKIIRKSIESALSLPWKLEDSSSIPPSDDLPHCGCGWPAHLLLPKGTTDGMEFDLFFMVTDGQIDHVEMPPSAQQDPEDVCISSHILCGTWNKPYPDARPMGYPFDRRPYNVPASGGGKRPVDDLDEFVMPIPNMKVISTRIVHQE